MLCSKMLVTDNDLYSNNAIRTNLNRHVSGFVLDSVNSNDIENKS